MDLPAKLEESNPGLARMTISEPMPSPKPGEDEETAFTSMSAPSQPPPPSTDDSLRRQEKPPAITLPVASPASIMAGMRHRSDPPLRVPPSPTAGPLSVPASVPATKPSTPGPATPGPWAGLPVLVVDDDSLTRMLMKRLLSRLGCRVSTAENGEVALELILGALPRQTPLSEDVPPTPLRTPPAATSEESGGQGWVEDQKYAVVFLDNQMPVMSGLELVAKLRELGRGDFVVGVTGTVLILTLKRTAHLYV